MIRLWHSPQKLCFYNSSNNNNQFNQQHIDRTKNSGKTKIEKNSVQLNILLPSSDSKASSIQHHQFKLTYMSTSTLSAMLS